MKLLHTAIFFKMNTLQTMPMKNTLFFLVALLLLGSPVMAQNADPSAALELNSTTKGFLPPRMTTLQRDNIVSPATGLVIFNTNTNSLNYHNGTEWIAITNNSSGGNSIADTGNSIADTDGNTKVNTEEAANEDIIRFDVGGTEAMVIDTNGNVGLGTAPNSAAALDITATNKGVLLPRVALTGSKDATTIPTPPTGLLVFNTASTSDVVPGFYFNVGTAASPFWSSKAPNDGSTVAADEILRPTGRIWKDRNLGATQVATSPTDTNAYGDLYQWGRDTDGHQSRTSTTIAGPVSAPGTRFITVTTAPFDWLSTQNDRRWDGENSANNPCPAGFRVPSAYEWEEERNTWSSKNAAGAFSALKLPLGGFRSFTNGAINDADVRGCYWSSSVVGTFSQFISFGTNFAHMISTPRAYGLSVRCIKD